LRLGASKKGVENGYRTNKLKNQQKLTKMQKKSSKMCPNVVGNFGGGVSWAALGTLLAFQGVFDP